jgi:hypothetical protein
MSPLDDKLLLPALLTRRSQLRRSTVHLHKNDSPDDASSQTARIVRERNRAKISGRCQAESKKTNLRRLLFQLEHSQFGVHVFIPLSLLGRQICAVPPERALGLP